MLSQEPDLEVLSNMLEAIQDTIRLVGPALLTQEQLGQAFERFRVVLDESAKRRKERRDLTTGEDFDEEEAENLEVGSLLCCAVLCCAALCCAALRCAELSCAVLC